MSPFIICGQKAEDEEGKRGKRRKDIQGNSLVFSSFAFTFLCSPCFPPPPHLELDGPILKDGVFGDLEPKLLVPLRCHGLATDGCTLKGWENGGWEGGRCMIGCKSVTNMRKGKKK